ncbi:zinc-binding alcohol dehydrogenase family protein [Enterocloster lavalensis]|uniref:zinc-binding alcohol dehydrogenase family protein n=1 Tax=Enterocloster lavalensis TaxID=460384 RepID=UPI001D0744B0|nr:zinc-binding alcohol dehydrogenase family protein [Enterocloster lavalensis]MCB6345887.1 zinc-binding alcohol dehydrogenase family protein [Enterocloster lavalensis]
MECRSIRINAPGEVEIIRTEMPAPGKDEALLKVLYGGICGSDLGSYRGTFAYFDYPRIPGHEFSAEIVEIDEENAYGLKKGMIVTCNPYYNCGKCYSCQRGLVNCCEHNETLGCQRDGAFSDYVVMPLERIYDGKGLPARTLALIEPFCISYHGVKRADLKAGDKVLVIGAGTIGILAAMAAKEQGGEVTICDVAQGKLDLARGFGLDRFILNHGDGTFADQVREATGANGFDVVIEAVGLPSTFENCIEAAAFGGKIVLIGVGKENLDFNFTMIQKKELNIFGSRNARKEDFEQLIELVRGGGVDLEKVVTDEYPFEEAERAFREFSENAGKMLKVVIRFAG